MLFISHSTLDKETALDLQRRLRERGYSCEQHFLDSDQRSGIKLGEKWETIIYDNLRDCRALLVLCSPNWLASKWCFAELAAAKMAGKQVFPIVLEECDRNSLSDSQTVFINHEDEAKREAAFERLFQDLDALVPQRAPDMSFNTPFNSWFQRVKNSLWGYDFFISYHWASGGPYAQELAEALRARGFDVFLDRAEYASGDNWQTVGEVALKNTQRLVLIATR